MIYIGPDLFGCAFFPSNAKSNRTQGTNISCTHLAGVFLGVGVTGGSVACLRVRRLGGVSLVSHQRRESRQDHDISHRCIRRHAAEPSQNIMHRC